MVKRSVDNSTSPSMGLCPEVNLVVATGEVSVDFF